MKTIHTIKQKIEMQNVLYGIAALFLFFWLIGFFIYNTGNVIHILLLIAVIAILLKIIKGNDL